MSLHTLGNFEDWTLFLKDTRKNNWKLKIKIHTSERTLIFYKTFSPSVLVKKWMLIENSLDANATEINVFVSGGGNSSLKVIDNGYGLFKDDLVMAFARHSTSKISTVSDLLNIDTWPACKAPIVGTNHKLFSFLIYLISSFLCKNIFICKY